MCQVFDSASTLIQWKLLINIIIFLLIILFDQFCLAILYIFFKFILLDCWIRLYRRVVYAVIVISIINWFLLLVHLRLRWLRFFAVVVVMPFVSPFVTYEDWIFYLLFQLKVNVISLCIIRFISGITIVWFESVGVGFFGGMESGWVSIIIYILQHDGLEMVSEIKLIIVKLYFHVFLSFLNYFNSL